MEANKVAEEKDTRGFPLIYCLTLGAASGFMIGLALNNSLLGAGVLLGLAAIITAIFVSQGNL